MFHSFRHFRLIKLSRNNYEYSAKFYLRSGIFELNPEKPILFMNLNRFTCDSTKVSFFRYLILIFHLNWGNIFLSKLKGGVHCHNCNIVVKLIVMILFMYFDISNLVRSNNFEIINSEFDTTVLLMNKGIKKRKQTKRDQYLENE